MVNKSASGFKTMIMFYGAMISLPVLLLVFALVTLLSHFLNSNIIYELEYIIIALIGIGSLVFGIIGIKQVYLHAK